MQPPKAITRGAAAAAADAVPANGVFTASGVAVGQVARGGRSSGRTGGGGGRNGRACRSGAADGSSGLDPLPPPPTPPAPRRMGRPTSSPADSVGAACSAPPRIAAPPAPPPHLPFHRRR